MDGTLLRANRKHLAAVQTALNTLKSEAQHSPQLLDWLSQLCVAHGLVAPGVVQAQQSKRVFERALIAGFWDTQHTTGVGYNLRAIKLAAAAVRERLSPEHWTLIEQTESAFFQPQENDAPVATSVWAQQLLARTSQLMAALTGAQTDRMSRDDGWRLLSIGRHIERLDFLAHALATAIETGCLQSQAGFDAVLALFDSTISFHAQYQQSRTPQALVALLVSSADNPRSLAWVAQTLRSRLRRIEHLADGATRQLAELLPEPPADPLQLWPQDSATPEALLALLAQYRSSARAVAEGLSGLFFTHSGQAAHSVGL